MRNPLIRIGTVTVALAVISLAACSNHTPASDPPPGPPGEIQGAGVISGADGGFYIIGGPKKKKRTYE